MIPIKRFIPLLLVFLGGIISSSSYAADTMTNADMMVLDTIVTALQSMSPKIMSMAVKTLSALMLLQWLITHYKELMASNDIESVVKKAAGLVAWFAVCWYAIDNFPQLIRAVGNSMIADFSEYFPDTSTVIASTVGISGALSIIAIAVGQLNTTAGIAVLGVAFTVAVAGVYLVSKVLLMQIELALNATIAPMSLSFLALNSMRDQGIAPFKALISLMYRVVIYAVICGAFMGLNNAAVQVAQKYSGAGMLDGITSGFPWFKTILSCAVGHLILIFLMFKSDGIASNLASGSTSLSSSDLVAATLTASAAAGMGQAMSQTTTSGAQSMSDFLKSIGGQSATISNRSDAGALGPAPTPPSGNMSMGGDLPHAPQTENRTDSGGEDTTTSSNGKSAVPEFAGVPNPPDDGSAADRGRRREDRQRARMQANGSAGIEAAGNGQNLSGAGSLSQALDRFGNQMQHERATTNVSINAHHE